MLQEIIQISFEKGIIENITQTTFAVQGKLNSVLFLENFDPNIQSQAIVIRNPWLTYGAFVSLDSTIVFTDEDATPGHFFNLVLQPNFYPFDWYYSSLQNNYANHNLIQHYEIINSTDPSQHQNHIVFCGVVAIGGTAGYDNNYNPYSDVPEPILCTLVAGQVVQYVGLGDIKQSFYEAHKDEAVYPHHYTIGKYQHSQRYGQSIFFTTIPYTDYFRKDQQTERQALTDWMKPYLAGVYQYFYWDITKKQDESNQYWNMLYADGYFKANPEVFSGWRVKTPTQVLKQLNTGIARYNQDDATYKDHKTDSEADAADMDIRIVMAEKRYTIIDTILPSSGRESRLVSLEKLRDFSNISIKVSVEQSREEESGALYYLTPEVPQIDGLRDLLELNGIVTKNVPVWKPSIVSGTNYTKDLQFPSIPIAFIRVDDHTKVLDKPILNGKAHVFYNGVGLGFKMLRYIDLNIPRPWYVGEKIPLVLTVTIDGVEHVLYKDTYVCSKDPGYRPQYSITPDPDEPGNLTSLEYLALMGDNNLRFIYPSEVDLVYGENNVKVGSTIPDGYTPYFSAVEPLFSKPDTMTTTIQQEEAFYFLQFTIQIKESTLEKLQSVNASNFKLYVKQPDQRQKIVPHVGIKSIQETPGLYYAMPEQESNTATQDDVNYSGYRLVKEFIVDGAGQGVAKEDYYFHQSPMRKSTNAWYNRGDGFVEAVSQAYTTGEYFDTSSVGDGATSTMNTDMLIDDGGAVGPGTSSTSYATPDYWLWDYPNDAPPLVLNNTGNYETILGARCVQVVKGVTFIAGVLGKDNVEKLARIYYCAVQNGASLFDVFPKENFFRLGNLQHTAMLTYRDHIVAFTRFDHRRVILHNPFDAQTWEFVEAVDGGGTFSNKTICVTPKGFAYCNENGIWISDGQIPTSLTNNPEVGLSVTGIYQQLMLGRNYPYQSLIDPGSVFTNGDYNSLAELTYNYHKDELILYTPIKRNLEVFEEEIESSNAFIGNQKEFTHGFMLIFNFANKNWRTESFPLSEMSVGISDNASQLIVGSNLGRRLVCDPQPIIAMTYANQSIIDPTSVDYKLKFVAPDYASQYTDDNYALDSTHIEGRLITHELGDDVNDYMLNKIIVAARTTDPSNDYEANPDPQFLYQTRNPMYLSASQQAPWVDLTALNMAGMPGNPYNSHMQTPNDIPSEANGPDNYTHAESFTLLAPLQSSFRHSRFKFISKLTHTIRQIVFKINVFKRRFH